MSVAGSFWILFLFSCIGAAQSCRHGWLLHGEFCYLYKQESFTFFEAKVSCDLIGGHLAEIHSDNVNNYLSELIRHNSGSVAWIGLEDLEVEGTFVWYPTLREADYTSWLPTDPNDYNNEDCVTTRNDGKWQDWQCETKHPYICQTANEEEIVG